MEKLRVEIRRIKVSVRLSWSGLRYHSRLAGAPAKAQAKIADTYDQALTDYDVMPYPGGSTLFIAERHLAGLSDRLGG